MTNKIRALGSVILLSAFCLADCSQAALPTYKTASAYGATGLPAEVVFAADANSQIRVIYVNYSSDSNAAAITFSTGTTAYSLQATNPTTSWTTNVVNSTNGMVAGQTLMLQHSGTCYTNTISTVGNTGTYTFTNGLGGQVIGGGATNVSYIITAAGGFGVLPSAGDDLFYMGQSTSWPVGATTNVIAGDAIFVGNYGRPVTISISLPNLTNRIYSASTHYDSQTY